MSTPDNPREVCRKLDLAQIWVYGDTTTKVTDGNMQEYVSKYLTQHTNFPRVLDKFPQRAFHSILLGAKDKAEVRELLKAGDFEALSTDYVVNKKVFDNLFPCPLRITLNCPSDLQVLPSIMLTQLIPCFVRFYSAPADSSARQVKSIMTHP